MHSGINRVVLFGNLGADPELRITQLGQAILKFRLATNEVYFDKERNLIEKTEWHSVAMFGPRAEPLSRVLQKGDSILVEGSIRYSSYEKDGVTRYRSEIVAREVCLTGHRKNRNAAAAQPGVMPDMVEDPFSSEGASTAPAANAETTAVLETPSIVEPPVVEPAVVEPTAVVEPPPALHSNGKRGRKGDNGAQLPEVLQA